MINDWNDLNVGDELIYHIDEFDGSYTGKAIVTEKYPDHLIVVCDDMRLWLDDDVRDMFYLKTIGVLK